MLVTVQLVQKKHSVCWIRQNSLWKSPFFGESCMLHKHRISNSMIHTCGLTHMCRPTLFPGEPRWQGGKDLCHPLVVIQKCQEKGGAFGFVQKITETPNEKQTIYCHKMFTRKWTSWLSDALWEWKVVCEAYAASSGSWDDRCGVCRAVHMWKVWLQAGKMKHMLER